MSMFVFFTSIQGSSDLLAIGWSAVVNFWDWQLA